MTDFSADLHARDKLERFVSVLDPQLAAYVRLRELGEQETALAYAKALGTTEHEIRNLNRRLQRLRKKWPG